MQTAINPDQHWSYAAACAEPGSKPDLWFSGGANPNWTNVAQARHICKRHCPVRQLCREEIGALQGAVVGGIFYNDKGRKSDWQPIAASCSRCTHG